MATLALLPVYFGRANERMVTKAIEASEVSAELESWSRWQWLRTALAASVVALSGWGLRREQAERAPKRSIRWQREGSSDVGRPAVEDHVARTSPPTRVNG